VIKILASPSLGKHVVAGRPFQSGESLGPLTYSARLPHPEQHSIQVSETEHLLLCEPLSLLNHSCDPNVFVDTEKLMARALRKIASGDELTFFYPSTEWILSHRFLCTCGAKNCLGEFAGASQIPQSALASYELNPHIQRLLLQKRR
jgi:hypothetical protein